MSTIEQIGLIPPIESTCLEVVERKGIGHPDTLATGAAEAASIAVCEYFKDEIGGIPYYNFDQLLLSGGEINVRFGSGELVRPTTLYLGGHVSESFQGRPTYAREIALAAAEDYVRYRLPNLPQEGLRSISLTTSAARSDEWHNPVTTADLPSSEDPIANDTSTTVSHWPLSLTERMTLAMEGFFYDDNGKPLFDSFGQDIKVMSIRKGDFLRMTLCVPMLSGHINNHNQYHDAAEALEQELQAYAEGLVGSRYQVDVSVNPEKDRNRVGSGYYMLNYGSCIESGEEGAPGRGNKQHGLIPTLRPMSMEAPEGKCTANFTGKIGFFYATEIAKRLSEAHDNADVQVLYSASMGDRLKAPGLIAVSASVSLDPQIMRLVAGEVLSTDHVGPIQDGYFMPKIVGRKKQTILAKAS